MGGGSRKTARDFASRCKSFCIQGSCLPLYIAHKAVVGLCVVWSRKRKDRNATRRGLARKMSDPDARADVKAGTAARDIADFAASQEDQAAIVSPVGLTGPWAAGESHPRTRLRSLTRSGLPPFDVHVDFLPLLRYVRMVGSILQVDGTTTPPDTYSSGERLVGIHAIVPCDVELEVTVSNARAYTVARRPNLCSAASFCPP